MGAHSLAEAYNNLTNQRNGYLLPPADASIIVGHAARTYSIITLTAEETMAVIVDIGNRNREGAIVYDALLLACARKIDAKAIYTWNVRHFRQIAPDLASRILEP